MLYYVVILKPNRICICLHAHIVAYKHALKVAQYRGKNSPKQAQHCQLAKCCRQLPSSLIHFHRTQS